MAQLRERLLVSDLMQRPGLSGALGFVVVTAYLLAAAGVASAGWVPWHRLQSIDRVGLTGLACPSAHLCVAVDGGGSVLTSSAPGVRGSRWRKAGVDGATALAGISCPAAGLCFAVDRAGNVVTSTDPAGGVTAWRVASLGRNRPLTTISCASESLCVAGDTTALVTTDPTGGPSAWVDTGAGGGLYYYCLRSPDISSSCNAPLSAISCRSAPLQCVTFGDAGGFGESTDPAAAPPPGRPRTRPPGSCSADRALLKTCA